jgi:hypothetical protein
MLIFLAHAATGIRVYLQRRNAVAKEKRIEREPVKS